MYDAHSRNLFAQTPRHRYTFIHEYKDKYVYIYMYTHISGQSCAEARDNILSRSRDFV